MSDDFSDNHPLTPYERQPLNEAAQPTTAMTPYAPYARTLGEEEEKPKRKLPLRLLGRYKWSILIVFLLLASPLLAAVWMLITPEYQSRAMLQVHSKVPLVVIPTPETGLIPQYHQYLRSQSEILTSDTVLRRVSERFDVQNSEWFKLPPSFLREALGKGQRPAIDRLKKIAEAEPLQGTELVILSVLAQSASDAKLLADAIMDEYVRYSSEQYTEEDAKLIETVQQERDRVRAEITNTEDKIRFLTESLRTTSPDELLSRAALRLDEIESQLADIDLEINVSKAQLAELEPEQTGETPETEVEPPPVEYEADTRWRDLNAAVKSVQQDIAVTQTRFGAKHPKMVELGQQLTFAQRELEKREAELDKLVAEGKWARNAPTSPDKDEANPTALRSRVQLLEIRRDYLKGYLSELRESFENRTTMAVQKRRYDEDLKQQKEKLTLVDRRLEQLYEKGRVPMTLERIGTASEPTEPYSEKRIKFSAVIVIGAMGIALAIAYLRLASSPHVQEAGDLHLSVQGAFLGSLPHHSRRSKQPIEQCPIQAEAVRMVRTALLHRLGGGKVVQITSSMPGAGKSTLAMLLGRSLAMSGKRVLLIDADIRRPVLAKRFDCPQSPGLLDLIARRNSVRECSRKTPFPGLHLLPAGDASNAHEVELLANGAFGKLLRKCRNAFDIVLVDSAPMMGVADAAILSRYVDGTIVVVRERHCRRDALVDSLSALSAAGGRLLGTVFVGSESSGGGRYGYGYGYGYGYTYADSDQAVDGFTKQDDD